MSKTTKSFLFTATILLLLGGCKTLTLNQTIADKDNLLRVMVPEDWEDSTADRRAKHEAVHARLPDQKQNDDRLLLEVSHRIKGSQGRGVGSEGCTFWSMVPPPSNTKENLAKAVLERSVMRFQNMQNQNLADRFSKGMGSIFFSAKPDKFEVSPTRATTIAGVNGWNMNGKLYYEGIVSLTSYAFTLSFYDRVATSQRILFIDCAQTGLAINNEIIEKIIPTITLQ